MTVQIVPSVIMKHAPKITKTVSESRPALKGAFHDTDGSITVTNSRYLWRVENAHAYPEPIVIDPITMARIEQTYPPNTKSLFPDPENATAVWEISLDKYTLGLLKSVKEAGRYRDDRTLEKKDKVLFRITGNTLSLYKSAADLQLKHFGFNNPDAKVLINAAYLLNTLEWMADELGERATVNMYYYEPIRPLLIEQGRVKAIIMPVREN